ncbi:Hypothetical predicted protein [Mytilus galloprovincialis]|uniref:C1q domain-containing protein n=1 Tax=Mytilus galloprovincialis TaxID=29158 RepID=A0A8B6F016_MYTGA|nr:Hypothetical predicted protein [Mytilus galloprovincialis]
MNSKLLPIYLTIILLLQIEPVLSQGNAVNTEERLQRLEIQLDRQQAINKELQTEISRLNLQVTECTSMKDQKRENSPYAVAFSTQLTTTLTGLGQHAAVIFDKVILDTTSSYNTGDGVFVVPRTGIYVFTWTVSVREEWWETTELVVNGTPYAYSLVDAGVKGDRGTGTQTVVLRVKEADHVLIRTGFIGDGNIEGNTYDTFSGWILFPYE